MSAGQVGPVPVQFSGTSQTPAAERHTVPEDRKPSAGQVALAPVHVSGTSQTPALERQTVPALPGVNTQVPVDWSQVSTVHPLLSLQSPFAVHGTMSTSAPNERLNSIAPTGFGHPGG